MEAEFQGSWHLYKTYPPRVISLSLWPLSLLSFGFLGHYLSAYVSLFLCSPLSLSPRVRVSGLAWPGLPVLV